MKEGKAEAARFMAQGVKPGVPDIFLDVARGGYHGLRIELKRNDGKSKPTTDQRRWLNDLAEQGYMARVCRGWLDAASVIVAYLDGRVLFEAEN